MVLADAAPGKVIMDIGCNKGHDAMKWMERWDMSSFWNSEKWKGYYDSKGVTDYACPEDVGRVFTTARQSTHTPQAPPAGSQKPLPIGVCVEPMQANINMLRSASRYMVYEPSETKEFGAFHIVQAAVLDRAAANETIDFADAAAGTETLGVQSAGEAKVAVPLKTVDGLVTEFGLPRVDILRVDTEGADPAVLRGAAGTLKSVRYLEFEVARGLKGTEWGKTTLASVVHELDVLDFECFWAGNDGKLLSMNSCWKDSFENGAWANAACVKRGDVWHAVLQRFTEQ